MTVLGPDLHFALERTACLGAWTYEARTDRLSLALPLARLLGVAADDATAVTFGQVRAGIDAEDGLRIDSMVRAGIEVGGLFEAELRTQPGPEGVRWLRLIGRTEREPLTGPARIIGLAFDLTEDRPVRGSEAYHAQHRVNRLAEHAVAMKQLVAELRNPPLAQLVDRVAIEVGFELARHLRLTEQSLPH